MILTLIPSALLAVGLGSTEAPPTLDVVEVAERIIALDGKVVRVRGWVSATCGGLGCGLRSRLARDERQAPRDVATISIAYDRAFEPALLSVAAAEIVLEGRIDASCRRSNVICTDRVPDIHPIKIIRVIQRSPD